MEYQKTADNTNKKTDRRQCFKTKQRQKGTNKNQCENSKLCQVVSSLAVLLSWDRLIDYILHHYYKSSYYILFINNFYNG